MRSVILDTSNSRTKASPAAIGMSVYAFRGEEIQHSLSLNGACLDLAFEDTYDGKAISSIMTSINTFEYAKLASTSLKMMRPDSIPTDQHTIMDFIQLGIQSLTVLAQVLGR